MWAELAEPVAFVFVSACILAAALALIDWAYMFSKSPKHNSEQHQEGENQDGKEVGNNG